nr:hypothetical protein N8D75_06900 [Curtobacterium flaccumfaciens]
MPDAHPDRAAAPEPAATIAMRGASLLQRVQNFTADITGTA